MKSTGPHTRKKRDEKGWTRRRIDYAAMEAVKILVDSFIYKDIDTQEKRGNFKIEFKFSILPWSGTGYLDIRKYIRGKPTGQGVLIHLERFEEVVEAMYKVRTTVERMKQKGLITQDGSSLRLSPSLAEADRARDGTYSSQ
jgi:hypothetical protein